MEENKKQFMKSPNFIISGGGTGGHIFPAIAIADELKKRIPQAEILFIGAKGKMEEEKVPAAGYPIKTMAVAGINRSSIFANFKLPFIFFKSIKISKKIIKEFQPLAVIGTGGYASFSALLAAGRMEIPTFIQEQNSFPGITNKFLGKKAKAIFVDYENMNQYFPKTQIFQTGNPVRKDIFKQISKEEAKKQLGLSSNSLTILSVGGSLGAGTINDFWMNHCSEIINDSVQLLWQIGKNQYPEIKEKLEAISNENITRNIVYKEFIQDMSTAYSAADIIISRAGAIAISELCIVGKACIFIPYPYAAEDHQTKNANYLVSKNAALMVKNSEVDQYLMKQIKELTMNEEKRKSLGEEIKKLAKSQATSEIVDKILELINYKTTD